MPQKPGRKPAHPAPRKRPGPPPSGGRKAVVIAASLPPDLAAEFEARRGAVGLGRSEAIVAALRAWLARS